MRLWFHPESDSLYLAEFQEDPMAEDVSDIAEFRKAARERGIKFTYEGPSTEVTSRNTIASAIVASYKRWERKPADLYPTPVDGTESVIPAIDVLAEYVRDRRGGKPVRVWEPACGDGRMSRVLEWHGYEVLSTDIRERPGYGIGGVDFLYDSHRTMGWWPQDNIDIIVTNPPFSLAEEFIRKALSITPNVAMLLKQSYWNAASRLPVFARHRPAFVLPLTFRLAFLEAERGKSPLMDCCWVVWSEVNDPDDPCIFEPLPRRRYPGYALPGVLSAMAGLEEAMGDLTETVRGLAEGRAAEALAEGR